MLPVPVWCIAALILLVGMAIFRGFAGKARLIIIIAIVTSVVCAFYTYSIRRIVAEQYEQRIDTLCKIIERDNEIICANLYPEIEEHGVENYIAQENNKEKIETMSRHLKYICKSFGEKDSFYADLFILQPDGRLRCFLSASNRYPVGHTCTPLLREMHLKGVKSEESFVDKGDSSSSYISKYSNVLRAGKVKAFNVAGCSYDNIKQVAGECSMGLFISLLAFCIAVCVMLRLGQQIIPKLKDIVSKDDDKRFAALTCSFSTLVFFTNGLDMVSFMLIVMYLAGGDVLQAAKVVTVQTAGVAVGAVLSPMLSRVKDRTVSLVAAFFLIVSQGLMIYAIVDMNLWFYGAAAAVRGLVSQGLLASTAYRIPFMIIDKQLQEDVLPRFYSGRMGGQLLGLLFGGVLAKYLGYTSIYAFAIFVALFEMLLIYLIPDTEAANAARKPTDFKKLLKAIFTPAFLVFAVLLVLPSFAARAYLYKYFPILAAGSSISPVLLSNVVVFIKTINFALHDYAISFFNNLKLSANKTVTLISFCAGILLASTALNSSILWTVVTATVITLIVSSQTQQEMLYYAGLTRKYGFDNTDAVNMETVVGFAGELISPALLWLVPVTGLIRAPYVLGIIIICCCVLYLVFCRVWGEKS